MSGNLEVLDASLVVMIATAETIATDYRDLSSDEARGVLAHLADMCTALVNGDRPLAREHIDAMKATRRRVWDAKQAAKQTVREADLIAEGWTPPEPVA